MGFVFNLAFVFVLLPLTVFFLIIWLFTRKKTIIKILGLIWFIIFILVLAAQIMRWLTAKTVLEKKDYYGEYTVNRDYFRGKQSDWQYEHFRFEIKQNDSIYFYVTDGATVLKTYRGNITTTKPDHSERLIIHMEQPTHHIIMDNPTIYRKAWSFYLVFHSPLFYNIYFKKEKWKPLER